ncbi:MAG: hypothetical protein HQL42_05675 [Alphaproteobacteria bacterium]|nr:hypothetical protein [Alphaproteobacteria bacterium]
MNLELRHGIRYLSSQKAVVVSKAKNGSLGVITNLSSGGLCVAMIGSPNPLKENRIDLKVHRRSLFCNVVNSGREGLHCQFDDFLDEGAMSTLFNVTRDPLPYLPYAAPQPRLLGHHSTYDRTGRWTETVGLSAPRATGTALARIYAEGCFVAREQIDPAIEEMDAAMEVLNPYQTPDERGHWARGFIDSIRHMSKYWPRSG